MDTVTAAMEEFNTKTTAEIEASLPDATLKKQAYYDVVDDLNRQYGLRHLQDRGRYRLCGTGPGRGGRD